MKYCFIADEYKQAIAALALKEPEDWMAYSVQGIVVDRTTETRRLKPPAPLPGCYAKIYRYPRWDDRLRITFRGGLLGRSRASVEYHNLRVLHARGLAPRVVAFGQQRIAGLLQSSLLISEEVPDARSLDQYIAGPFQTLTPQARRDVIDRLAAFTRQMNAGGFINSEYHWRNILVINQCDGVAFQLIDPSSSRRRYRLFYPFFDVATLDVCAPFFFTRTERLRFFKQYLDRMGRPLTKRHKKWLQQIAVLRSRISQKELKRYRAILPTP